MLSQNKIDFRVQLQGLGNIKEAPLADLTALAEAHGGTERAYLDLARGLLRCGEHVRAVEVLARGVNKVGEPRESGELETELWWLILMWRLTDIATYYDICELVDRELLDWGWDELRWQLAEDVCKALGGPDTPVP